MQVTFEEFFRLATGQAPYPYQARLVADGLPDVLEVPTGSGKTAVVLPWLYLCVRGEDAARRLVFVLPQRALVEQTVCQVVKWLERLGDLIPRVGVHVLMGGERDTRPRLVSPGGISIVVGTQDMVLSRVMNRGYAESRFAWPRDFGVLNSGTQFVFDELQLMGPGLPTSLQMQALRDRFGTALPTRSMWMSATVPRAAMSTVDFSRDLRVEGLRDDDRAGALKVRLDATRVVSRLRLESAGLAERVVAEHRPGTRTLVVRNTVDRAVELYEQLGRVPGVPEVVVLHSRFRPDDRRRLTDRAVDMPEGIIVATQVLEAGIDTSSTTLITEVAPWSSMVQRAGRCNRAGTEPGARVLWFEPDAGRTAHLPYEADDLAASVAALTELEGTLVTGEGLGARVVASAQRLYPVVRDRDLLDLFDTAADTSGSDIDVGRFIRDTDDRTVFVAWRDRENEERAVGRAELCPAPIAAVRTWAAERRVRVFDPVESEWRTATPADVRPTAVLVLDAALGGYSPEVGFAPASRTPVPPVLVATGRVEGRQNDYQHAARWATLVEHSTATEKHAETLWDDLKPDMPDAVREAVVLAARYHDLGKTHEVFQTSLRRTGRAPDHQVYAKSPSEAPLRHDPAGFRHELVSALLLRDSPLLEGIAERDLVVYLALAHHGKVRVTVRGHPGEPANQVLGVVEGSSTWPVEWLPAGTVSLAATRLGAGSLTDRALRLRDRADLGPFRVAFCEAIVRAADARASAEES